MNLDRMFSFAEFARHLNFTHAAETLNISQPALHVQIKKLSESLGVTLYRKEGGRLVLTSEGQKVKAFAEDLKDRIDMFVGELQKKSKREPVRLVAGSGSFIYLLCEGIRAFTEAGGTIEGRPLQGESCIQALLMGEAHLGVVALDTQPENLKSELLAEVPMKVIMPHNHPLAKKESLTIEDLDGQPLIVPPSGRPHRVMINRVLSKVRWRKAQEAGSWELMTRFTQYGMGLAIINACCNIPPELVSRPIQQFPSIRYFLLHRANSLDPAKQLLRKCLLEHGSSWKTE